jgi:hypothetical protein
MESNVQTVELLLHDLTYRGHRQDRITHCPDGCSHLPITVSWGRNPNACQTLNGVQTVLPRRLDGCTWTLDSSRTLNSGRTIRYYVRTDYLEQFEASGHRGMFGQKVLIVRTDVADWWASGRNTTSSRWMQGNWTDLFEFYTKSSWSS